MCEFKRKKRTPTKSGEKYNLVRISICKGAATLRLRKLASSSGINHTSRRFNGAATLRLRKCRRRSAWHTANNRASMGPQLYGCGNIHACGSIWYSAAASMGPQLYGCGNLWTTPLQHPTTPTLQWGRNFTVAEICNVGSHIVYTC